MTTRDTAIEDAIAWYRMVFRLTDWEIRYDPDNDCLDPDASSEVKYDDGGKHAVIRIDHEVPDGFCDWHVVHELWHLVTLDRMFLTNDVLAKCGDAALGVIDTLNRYLERECELVAEVVTGQVWRPIGKEGEKVFRPFVIDHSLTRNTEVPTNA